MRRFYLKLAVLCFGLGLTGCAHFNTAFRTYNNQNNSVMVDVKQRAIIAGAGGHDTNYRPIICAEPSPDALSAYAAELAGSITTPQQIKGDFAAAFQEGSAYVGLRTQSIQLLRDSMYRLCESHMNGAIDDKEYGLLARRYQKNMVALLAIEQLTGTVKVNPITINTQGSASMDQTIDQILEAQNRLFTKRDSINSDIVRLDKKIGEYKAQLEKIPPPSDKTDLTNKKLAAETQVSDSRASLAIVEAGLKQLDEAIKNPRGLAVRGFTSSYATPETPQTRSDVAISAIAENVTRMVRQIIEGDDTLQMCLTYYSQPPLRGKNPEENAVIERRAERLERLCDTIMNKEEEQLDLFRIQKKQLKNSLE